MKVWVCPPLNTVRIGGEAQRCRHTGQGCKEMELDLLGQRLVDPDRTLVVEKGEVPCARCEGSGKVMLTSAIPPLEVTCGSCRGEGKEKWAQWVIDVIQQADGGMAAITSGRFSGNYRSFLNALKVAYDAQLNLDSEPPNPSSTAETLGDAPDDPYLWESGT